MKKEGKKRARDITKKTLKNRINKPAHTERHVIFLAAILLILSFLFFISFDSNFHFTGFTIYTSQPTTEGKDTYIRQNSNNNYGDQQTLLVGKTAGGIEFRSLIEFNISEIPPENTITSALLSVYVSSATNTNNITIKLYRLTSSWVEGTGTIGTGASWNNASESTPWSTGGGDYANELSSVTFTNQSSMWYNFTITSAVRGWINGSYSNYGLILISTDAGNGKYTSISSAEGTDSSLAPRITIDYTENAIPSIDLISTNTNPTNLKQVGEDVIFTIGWSDLENNNAKILICNSSNISYSYGCGDRTFCNTSYSSTSPTVCQYTVTNSENRTQNFFVSVCDSNCSSSNQSQFYINHNPNITLIQPNGGETVNQSQGNYLIKFNVSDKDLDSLTASIYYGESPNSTTNIIASNIDLSTYCTDTDSNKATTNNCSYSWDSTGIYGTYYLTININDSFSIMNGSSNSSFNVRSITDSNPPNILSQTIDSGITSGKTVYITSTITDFNIITAWVSFNYTSTNITMTNVSTIFSASFIAPAIGTYKFKVYARDVVGNLNDSMPWQEFNVTKPYALALSPSLPSTSLPYHVIKVSSQLNATDFLRNVYAYLNVPEGFTFLLNYPQNILLGNLSANENKTATWFLSGPLPESTYSINTTFTDFYSNNWDSPNSQIQVTSSVGGGYSVSVSGYPEVSTGNMYYTESYFKLSGVFAAPDTMQIRLYDAAGNPATDWVSMTQKSTGIYNYSYATGGTTGKWQTIINATKSGTSYYDYEFWDLLGGPFDVEVGEVIVSLVPKLNISIKINNTGSSETDYVLLWNLTREDTGAVLNYSQDASSIRINSNSIATRYITPSTSYIGQVRITTMVYYGSNLEKTAGAYRIFSTTSENVSCGDSVCSPGESCSSCPSDCGTCPVTPPTTTSTGGGGATPKVIEKPKTVNFNINVEKEINITKNIEKIITLEIENTGDADLTNVSLILKGLEAYTKITPAIISLIKPGKKGVFEITLLVSDFTGEKDFEYAVFSNELNKTEMGKMYVIAIKDYFNSELLRLRNKISLFLAQAPELKEEINICENIVNSLELEMQKENYIDAKSTLNGANSCLQKIEDKIAKARKGPLLGINLSDYGVWIITWALIISLIIVLAIIAYIIYKKAGISGFIRTEQANQQNIKPSDVKKEYLEKKLRDIEEKLK
ncbi:MAG: DNRLRE domain-containing protein [archaeon]